MGWLTVLGWLWCSGVAALCLVRFLDLTGPVPAIQAALPMALLSLLVLLVLSLVGREPVLAAATGLLLLVGAVGAAPWFWPHRAGPSADSDTVVLAANLEFGRGSMAEIVELVRERDVDALVLLEATPATAERLADSPLTQLLPHVSGTVRDDAGGTLVLTADPHVELADPPDSTFTQVAVRVEGPASGGCSGEEQGRGRSDEQGWDRGEARSGTVGAGTDVDATVGQGWTLVAVHPAPPLVTTSSTWRADLKALEAWVAANDDDCLVLAGDFNASQAHPAFRALAATLTHAHRETGAGWVRTWPMGSRLPPFVQLDHVLARGFGVEEAGVADVPGSDHRAVWARLR